MILFGAYLEKVIFWVEIIDRAITSYEDRSRGLMLTSKETAQSPNSGFIC